MNDKLLLAAAIDYHKTVEGEYGCNGATCPGVQRLVKLLQSVQDPPWCPRTFGGSPTIASQLGLMAMFAARAGYDDTAATFARWAWREALQYFDVMDKKQPDGEPFELYTRCARDL